MTDQYAELRAALAAGPTPGPWRIGAPPPNGEQTIGAEGLMVAVATTGGEIGTIANARYIAAANPDTISALLKERDELLGALRDARRENERLRKDAARYRWLRRCRDLGDHTGVWEQLCGTGFRMRLDTFIDAILAADKTKEPPDE